MLKIERYISLGLTALALLAPSCQEEAGRREPVPVALAAETQLATRAAYTLASPTMENPLHAAVWMSTTQHTFEDLNLGANQVDVKSIAYHNTATFTGGNKQLPNVQMYYPDNGARLYFVGLYPQEGWSTEAAAGGTTRALFTLDGKSDVMFAPEVSNSIITPDNYPILQFRHLLTWIRLRIYADSEESIDAWGKVTDISIESKDQLAIDLASGSASFSEENPGTTLPAYLTEGEVSFVGQAVELTEEVTEVAYILCSPVNASTSGNEYLLNVNTTGRPNLSVPINLKDASQADYLGSTQGRQFTVTLKFVEGDNILTTTTISPWQNGGSAIYTVDE